MGLRIEDHLDDGNNGKPNGSPSNGGGQPRRRASLTQSVLDRLELEAQQQRKLDYRRAKAKWVILPDARFLTVWLAIIGPLIVYNVIWVPIEVSQMAAPTTTHGQIDFILDFFFYVDMILTFRTAYIDKDNELVLDGKQIANRYIFRGNFVVDLIATLQWEVFFTCLSGNGCQTAFTNTEDAGGAGAVFSVFRLPRLLRLIRLFKKIDRYPSLKVFKVSALSAPAPLHSRTLHLQLAISCTPALLTSRVRCMCPASLCTGNGRALGRLPLVPRWLGVDGHERRVRR